MTKPPNQTAIDPKITTMPITLLNLKDRDCRVQKSLPFAHDKSAHWILAAIVVRVHYKQKIPLHIKLLIIQGKRVF